MAGKSRIQAGSCFRQSSNEASNHVFICVSIRSHFAKALSNKEIRLKVPQRLFTDIFGIPQKQRMDNVILSFPRVPTHFTVGNRLVKKRETGVKMSRFLHPRPSHWEEKSRKSALLAPLLDGKTVSWPTLLVFPKSLGITRAQRIPHESSLRLCTYVDMRLVLKRKVE